MELTNIQKRLFELQDKEYALFQGKLIPTIDVNRIIGVRLPLVRNLAKELAGTEECEEFMKVLPHYYYDENMLHGSLISNIKDYDKTIEAVDRFLPYVDNWAVCDTMSPKVFKKHREELIKKVKEWSASDELYTCRFGIGMLMAHYLDNNFKPEYLDIPASIHSDEYYINMMIAWYFATALAKQWETSVVYLEEGRLDTWVHNKTIQKARESLRVSDDRKEYLKGLKRAK